MNIIYRYLSFYVISNDYKALYYMISNNICDYNKIMLIAVKNNHKDMVDYLISKGANTQ